MTQKRIDVLQEIERETSLLQIRTERALFFRKVENWFDPIFVPLSPSICNVDEPIV